MRLTWVRSVLGAVVVAVWVLTCLACFLVGARRSLLTAYGYMERDGEIGGIVENGELLADESTVYRVVMYPSGDSGLRYRVWLTLGRPRLECGLAWFVPVDGDGVVGVRADVIEAVPSGTELWRGDGVPRTFPAPGVGERAVGGGVGPIGI